MNPSDSAPLDPSALPTEREDGEPASDSDPTIVDDDGFDADVLNGLGDFLERLSRFWQPKSSSPTESHGDPTPSGASGSGSFERYELLERVGQGGFGLVFRARDPLLNREVALKIPRPEVLMTPSLRRRFLREARAAAALDHPNIVPVHDTGQVGPLCYIASAFCEGPTLSAWLRSRTEPVAAEKAARLIQTLAIALQHAHDHGILHRDLKPSNILLQGNPNEHDLDRFVPRISDFGLAKIADEIGDDTRSEVPMGSPPYMAPEQALGQSRSVVPASDVYALGAILYQVLTGRFPFEGQSRVELLRHIVESDPVSPRSHRPSLDRDMETICLKCLRKDPLRRYPTAQALADDLGRFLRGEPVQARPTSARERAAKWCRRKPWQAAAVVLVAATILGSAGGIVWRADTLRRHNDELKAALDLAQRHEASTRRLLYDSRIRLAQQAFETGNAETAQEILAGLQPEPGRADLRGFEWHYLNRVARRDVSLLFDHRVGITCLALSPDGRTLILGDEEGQILFWDLTEGQERLRVRAHSFKVGRLLFSPDGRTLASWTSDDATPGEAKLWDPSTGRELASVAEPAGGRVHNVLFSGDGRTLAIPESRGPQWVYVFWDLSQGPERARRVSDPIACGALAFSPDGRWLATVAPESPGAVILREPSTRRPVRSIASGSQRIFSMVFTPDGKRLAATVDHSLVIWETDSGREIASFDRLPPALLQLSPDGDRLVAITVDGEHFCTIADLKTRPRLVIPGRPSGRNTHAAFSPDGGALAIGAGGKGPTIWNTTTGREMAVYPKPTGDISGPVFSDDGQSLIFPGEDGRVRRWKFGQRREPIQDLPKSDKEVWTLASSPDGSTLASAGDDHLIRLWNTHDGTLKATLKGHSALVFSVAFSPDGARLASAGFDKTVRIWDVRSREPLAVLKGHTDRVRAVAFSPDGRTLASASSDKTVRIWDVASREPRFTFRGHQESVHAIAFNHDGTILVSASNDRTIKGIDTKTGVERFSRACPKHSMSLTFSLDGSLLASTDDIGSVTLWDTGTWTERMSVKGSDATVWGVSFSPDGKTLATACDDGKVRLWDPVSGQMVLELAGHSKRVNAVTFSPDGKTLASASHDGAIKLWQAGDPNPLASK